MVQRILMPKKITGEELNALIDRAANLIRIAVDKKLETERKRREKLKRMKKALIGLLLTGKIGVRVN